MEKYKIDTMSKYLQIPFSSIRITSMQAIQYKIVNRIFNCNHWLAKLKIINSPQCRFCKDNETIEHYFYECEKTKEYWDFLKNW